MRTTNLPDSVALAAMATGVSGVIKTDEFVDTAVVSMTSSFTPVGKIDLPREAVDVEAPRILILSVTISLDVNTPSTFMLPCSSIFTTPLLNESSPRTELMSERTSSNFNVPTVSLPVTLRSGT